MSDSLGTIEGLITIPSRFGSKETIIANLTVSKLTDVLSTMITSAAGPQL